MSTIVDPSTKLNRRTAEHERTAAYAALKHQWKVVQTQDCRCSRQPRGATILELQENVHKGPSRATMNSC